MYVQTWVNHRGWSVSHDSRRRTMEGHRCR